MTSSSPIATSIADVVDVELLRGARAPEGAAPDLLIEIPHGATRTADFTSVASRMESPLPDGLSDFFHEHRRGRTGARPATARRLVALDPPARWSCSAAASPAPSWTATAASTPPPRTSRRARSPPG
nr:hypothetical protein [Deltaproteobacteria bacterium]